ncbi:MAG: capsid cement protein [Gemmatimonadaceae bacterium]
MARNIIFEEGDQIQVVCTDPTTPASGDPVLVGQLPGVALITEGSDGLTTIKTNGVATLSVKGTTGSNAAIAAGDIIYYVTANTPKLSATTSGVRFGYALESVTSGATATIRVKIGY